jgi:hypothetical protein
MSPAPVTFPPGRFKLITKPASTGSEPVVKTIGTSAVADRAARAGAMPPVAAIAATPRRTSDPQKITVKAGDSTR